MFAVQSVENNKSATLKVLTFFSVLHSSVSSDGKNYWYKTHFVRKFIFYNLCNGLFCAKVHRKKVLGQKLKFAPSKVSIEEGITETSGSYLLTIPNTFLYPHYHDLQTKSFTKQTALEILRY